MELYKELLCNVLQGYDMQVSFKGLKGDIEKILENQCYAALLSIKKIIEDDSLDDKECFQKIEAIVTAFEIFGSNGGGRHDF